MYDDESNVNVKNIEIAKWFMEFLVIPHTHWKH